VNVTLAVPFIPARSPALRKSLVHSTNDAQASEVGSPAMKRTITDDGHYASAYW
jgi:hypothetical protein